MARLLSAKTATPPASSLKHRLQEALQHPSLTQKFSGTRKSSKTTKKIQHMQHLLLKLGFIPQMQFEVRI